MMSNTIKKVLLPLVDTEEELETWWITPNEGLGGKTPQELFDKIPPFAKTMAKSFLS
jgi:hypothetical protein